MRGGVGEGAGQIVLHTTAMCSCYFFLSAFPSLFISAVCQQELRVPPPMADHYGFLSAGACGQTLWSPHTHTSGIQNPLQPCHLTN